MDNQNPFLQILQQARSQQPGMGMGHGMAGAMAAQQSAVPMAEGEELPPTVDQKGITGDSTKPLLQAAQAIHAYIADSTDRSNIAVARSVLTLLASLVNQDQQQASQMDQQEPGQEMMEEEY